MLGIKRTIRLIKTNWELLLACNGTLKKQICRYKTIRYNRSQRIVRVKAQGAGEIKGQLFYINFDHWRYHQEFSSHVIIYQMFFRTMQAVMLCEVNTFNSKQHKLAFIAFWKAVKSKWMLAEPSGFLTDTICERLCVSRSTSGNCTLHSFSPCTLQRLSTEQCFVICSDTQMTLPVWRVSLLDRTFRKWWSSLWHCDGTLITSS